MPRQASDSPAAQALRDEGFVKLRPLWVPRAMRDQVEAAAEKYFTQIEWIKSNARRE